ncbi:MAG: hypothetical protein E7220_07155 [Clostridiales bacterium]|nr:hypothetical protein [Clostridiales bacterium]
MIDILYKLIYWVAEVHNHILSLNDSGQYYFDDKQLHFIVIGLLGMLMIFIVYPIFKLLAKYNHTMVIAWIYVFTLIMVITFAIEIGQWYSGTGSPEMADISAGVTGFLAMFLVFAVVRGIFHLISKLFKDEDDE